MIQKSLTCLPLGILMVFVTGAAINRPPAGTSRATFSRWPSGVRAARNVVSTRRFHYPTGVAVDAAGTVYIADQGSSTIRTVSPVGKVGLLACQVGNASYDSLDLYGPGQIVRFNALTGVAVDAAGAVYVADTGNRLIRKISPAGVVSTLAGQ